MKPETESITLRTRDGGWLGQIVLTSDGAYLSLTDWGNFNYAWRAFSDVKTLKNFKDFLTGINVGYFESKMREGISYTTKGITRELERRISRYCMNIFPVLQEQLKQETGAQDQAEEGAGTAINK